VAAIIGGGWRGSRSGHRCNPARSGCRCGGNRRTKIFGAYAHDGAIALNLNLAEPGLM